MRIALLALICAFSMGLASQASASIVYQSVSDLTQSPSTSICSPCSYAPTNTAGQAFSLANAATVTNAEFAIQGDYNWPSPVTLSIFLDAGGKIGNKVFSQEFTSYSSDTFHSHYMSVSTDIVKVNFLPVSLSRGDYLFFITGATELGVPMFETAWGSGGMVSINNNLPQTGVNYVQTDFLSAGITFGNAIPEPSTWNMLLIGFFGVGSALRGRDRRLVGYNVSLVSSRAQGQQLQ